MVKKMIEKIEHLAEILIPYRKWMIIAFIIAAIIPMPASGYLTSLFKQPLFFSLGISIMFIGISWSWGLFLISFWYNPKGGPLSLEKIKTTHPLLRKHSHTMRYLAPCFLLLWFAFPILVMCILTNISVKL